MHPVLDGGAPLTAAATTTHHHRPDTPALGERAGPAVAFFARAADYLHRPSRACPRHHVIHTGKLARAIPLDLALLRATGEPAYARRAIEQARFVTSRLARDPEHGGWIYLPGRFDPRNCSNSIIDSGECTGALAQLLLAPDATLTPDDRAAFASAVERNAATYLCRAVLEKEITNQRLWGAMGLASAYRLDPRAAWRDVLVQAVEQSLDEQGRDGAWGYQPRAAEPGAFRGAADLTVYYHSRCLAFLLSICEALPELLDWPPVREGLERGLELLAALLMPDGTKPLALEGKRWFWDGSDEAGSNAYDVFALLRGAALLGRPEWREPAAGAWRRLMQHQQADGSILACLDRGAHDFVCPDFHTADLAWPAQVIDELAAAERPALAAGDSPAGAAPLSAQPVVRRFDGAGVVRLEGSGMVALLRTTKQPRNTLFGGAVGGGTLVYAGSTSGGVNRVRLDREAELVEGSFTLYASRPALPAIWRGLRRFLADNPPGREGRQWLFVARLLAAEGQPGAATGRLWRGYLRPLVSALRGPAAAHWALDAELEIGDGWVRATCRPAAPDGSIPTWAQGVAATRTYWCANGALAVENRIERAGIQLERAIAPEAPAAASESRTEHQGIGRSAARTLSLGCRRIERWFGHGHAGIERTADGAPSAPTARRPLSVLRLSSFVCRPSSVVLRAVRSRALRHHLPQPPAGGLTICFQVPAAAREVEVEATPAAGLRRCEPRRIELRTGDGPFALAVRYLL